MSIYNITTFGAFGDGVTDNSQAIADAIEDCSNKGGGTVYVPAGTYVTGRIELCSQMTLELECWRVIVISY